LQTGGEKGASSESQESEGGKAEKGGKSESLSCCCCSAWVLFEVSIGHNSRLVAAFPFSPLAFPCRLGALKKAYEETKWVGWDEWMWVFSWRHIHSRKKEQKTHVCTTNMRWQNRSGYCLYMMPKQDCTVVSRMAKLAVFFF